jgi:hypothetical protein
MKYKQKYLKYKQKYLKYKQKKFILKGGYLTKDNDILKFEKCLVNYTNIEDEEQCIEYYGGQFLSLKSKDDNINDMSEFNKSIIVCTNTNNEKYCIEYYGKQYFLKKINNNKYFTHIVKKCSDNFYYIMNKLSDSICTKPDRSEKKFTWKEYKKLLSNNQKNIIYNFRQEIVDSLIKFIFENFKNCKHNANIICNFNASGSTGNESTLNSDYDLTLNGHYKISKIIQIFNSIFENEFRGTSSEIFDTNLYGYSFLIPQSNTLKNTKIWTPVYTSITQCEINTMEKYSVKQDKWAYLRLKSLYITHIKDLNLSDILELKNIIHNNYFNLDKNNLNILSPSQKQKYYLDMMYNFETLMNLNTDDKIITTDNEQIKKDIIESLSNMNYYGDETYFTQGSFIHVVGLMYLKTKDKKAKKALFKKKYYLIHSMIENMAYFINSYYENNDIIYAIKYYNRFINALLWFCKIYPNNTIYNSKFIKQLIDLDFFTVQIKSEIRNRTDIEIIKAAKEIFFISDTLITSIANILINQLNIIINKCLKKLKLSSITVKSKHFYLESMLKLLKYIIDNTSDYTQIKINYKDNKYIIT